MSRRTAFWSAPLAIAALLVAACQGPEASAVRDPGRSVAEAPRAPPMASGAGQACGGEAASACASGEFCKAAVGECQPDAAGVCTPRPDVCTREYMPVCGCDGRTYGNRCEADAAGVNVAEEGACEGAGA